MNNVITIRLDADLQRRLDDVCDRSGRSRSEVVRDAIRRQVSLIQFEQLRRDVLPFAEARGYLTDEDVFNAVS
jgi:predicted transcriptional regulator